MKIAIAGAGYVGLANAMLLSQHNEAVVDIITEKIEMLSRGESLVVDVKISEFPLNRELNFTATLEKNSAYTAADYVIIATPTDYDPVTNYFDANSVETVISDAMDINPSAFMVIKSRVPVGCAH